MSDTLGDRKDQMFPRLDQAQEQRLAALGRRRQSHAGEILFESGERNNRFFVVVSGAVEVLHPTPGGHELVTLHGPGQFTGETTLMSGRPSLVMGRVREAGELLELDLEALRAVVQRDSELSELFLRAFILRRMSLIAHDQGDALLVGSRHDAGTLRLQEFLTRNLHPHRSLDVERDATVQTLFAHFGVGVEDLPLVICHGSFVLKNPSNQQLADCLGFVPDVDAKRVRDLIVVGAGPSGLAAAVYAASEGLDVLVLESNAPGGQAGSSSKIENYLGFPTGISGAALAGRALAQAEKFGAEIAVARSATRLHCEQKPYRVVIDRGEELHARAIVVATGVQYRKLPLPDLARFEGAGIYYGATQVESQLCTGEEVIIVGGGNSAGQAAVFLSRTVRHVHILVRGPGLADTMSRYLIRRIEDSANITLHARTEISALDGEGRLERVRWRHADSGAEETRDIGHLFLMTGADPHTAWLDGCLALDDKGFIKTGSDLGAAELTAAKWPLGRPPLLLETSLPGVFAVGDVRSSSVKRVASAVGEGSICIQLVHKALTE